MNSSNKCTGFVKTKQILALREKSVSEIKNLHKPVFIACNINLLEALRIMRIRKTQMLIVTDRKIQENHSGNFSSRSAREIEETDFKILGFVY